MIKLSEAMDVSKVAHTGTPLPDLLRESTEQALKALRARAADDGSRHSRPQLPDPPANSTLIADR